MEDTRVWGPYCDVRYGLRVGTVKLHTCVAKGGILQRLRGNSIYISPGEWGRRQEWRPMQPPSPVARCGDARKKKGGQRNVVAFWTVDARWPYGTVGDKAKGVT